MSDLFALWLRSIDWVHVTAVFSMYTGGMPFIICSASFFHVSDVYLRECSPEALRTDLFWWPVWLICGTAITDKQRRTIAFILNYAQQITWLSFRTLQIGRRRAVSENRVKVFSYPCGDLLDLGGELPYIHSISLTRSQGMEPIPADIGRAAGYAMDGSPVHHRADIWRPTTIQTYIGSYGQFRVNY